MQSVKKNNKRLIIYERYIRIIKQNNRHLNKKQGF